MQKAPSSAALHTDRLIPRAGGTASFSSVSLPPSLSATLTHGEVHSNSSGSHLLSLHFLGLSGLATSGWLRRSPSYEFIVHAGGTAKRLRPRIPAPPGSAGETAALTEMLTKEQREGFTRLDERLMLRMTTPAEFFHVDVWEETTDLLDFSCKGANRRLVGQCYVPLESQFDRRPCAWTIVRQNPNDGSEAKSQPQPAQVGFLMCKFGFSSTPGAVQNLRIEEGSMGAAEVTLLWDFGDAGGSPVRGFRAEARDTSVNELYAAAGDLAESTRTASAASSAQSLTLHGLRGNTAYRFRVWAINEAGAGAAAEIVGRTGPVQPGACGDPFLVTSRAGKQQQTFLLQWAPPLDNGGAAIVAYRVLLRFEPGDGIQDLGLAQHRGSHAQPQSMQLPAESIAAARECYCSIIAYSALGLAGPPTHELPLLAMAGLRIPAQQQQRQQTRPSFQGRTSSVMPHSVSNGQAHMQHPLQVSPEAGSHLQKPLHWQNSWSTGERASLNASLYG
mmetsp:Transcript_52814/g.123542  ORF Transcript_52814/g.123542 Transcript_52814/m.123542 type:complete len:503 (-) Transcript_52814:68-1576(-)